MDSATIAKLMKRYPIAALATGNIRVLARLSYPHLLKAKAGKPRPNQPPQAPKFSTAVLLPLGSITAVLDASVAAAALEEFGVNWKQMRLTLPIRDQGEKIDENGVLADGYTTGAKFFNCTSNQRPGVVGADGLPIGDESKIYAGVWALVTVRTFAYRNEQKGVSFGLQNVQIVADDDRIGGGRPRADAEFEPLDASMGAGFDDTPRGGAAGISAYD